MKETTINKKVTTTQVELDEDDLDFIITTYFKQRYNATTSEVTVDFKGLGLNRDDFTLQVTYQREEEVQ